CVCPLPNTIFFPPQLVGESNRVERKRQTKGVGQLAGQGECLLTPLQGLGWIAEQPQSPRRMNETEHPGVLSIEKRVSTMLPGIVERSALFQQCPGGKWLSQKQQGLSERPVGFYSERCRIL